MRRTTITDVFIFHPLGSFDLFYLFRIVSRFVFSHIFSENLKKTKFFSSCDELPIFRRFHVARLVFPLIFVVFFVFFSNQSNGNLQKQRNRLPSFSFVSTDGAPVVRFLFLVFSTIFFNFGRNEQKKSSLFRVKLMAVPWRGGGKERKNN